MVEIKQVRQTTKERRGFFPEVHRPLRNDYVSVEELVREFSHNKPGLYQPLSSFFTKAIFSMKRQDHSPHKLVAAQHNLGS
jgi:hypothetical protein